MYSFFLPLMSSFCFYIYKIPCFKRVFIFSFLSHFIGSPIFFLFMLIPHCCSLLFPITYLLSNFTISFVLKLVPSFQTLLTFHIFNFLFLRQMAAHPMRVYFLFFFLFYYLFAFFYCFHFFSFFISVLCCIHIICI
jgi:hypothetical protein